MTDSNAGVGDRGRRVAVRSRFDGSWCGGFELAAAASQPDGSTAFQLRRVSDGALLPAWFGADEVAPDGH